MSSATSIRIFLSYSRGDDEGFVRRLYGDLKSSGLTVWFDRESLMSRGLNFHQEIKDAIRTEVDRVIYVGGPKAALSAYVREEWQFALECDHIVVTPILRIGDYENCVPGELGLLHCEDFRCDDKYPAALTKLIASLRQPNPKLGALFAVPNLPPHFLGRPDLMRRVRDALLVDLQKPQVITSADAKVGVQGMGGIGKSVLAAALARNREIRRSYPDGIIWISCGQKLTRDDLLGRLRDMAKHLGGDTSFDSIPQGQGVLRELLQAKAVLLVLDDVWQSSDAQTFDVIGPRCRMLVTTRDAGILHALHGELVPVSLLTEPEALQLLADAVGCERSALPPEALEVVRECGCLPLAVALSGGMAKKRGGDFRNVLERLRRADLDKIADRASINEQHQSIWRAMQASVEVLSEDVQLRFAELSVFTTDRTVPEAAVATLWSHTGHLDDIDAEDLLINLAERSLVRLDEKTDTEGKMWRRVSLHDLLHDYTVRIAGEPKALHQSLVDAYRKQCPDGWHSGPNDGYFFENLTSHLADIVIWPECVGLVTDFPWLMRKCELGLHDSISGDYSSLAELAPAEVTRRLEIWSAFFREKAHILRRGKDEWPAHKILLQLAVEHADDSPLTFEAERWLADGRCDWIWLRRNRRPSFVQVNPCLIVLEGHTSSVLGGLPLPNGGLVSWSNDKTLRFWNLRTGQTLAVLSGHSNVVRGALALADGRILSWSDDKTLRVWDRKSGQCLAVLEGHSNSVNGAVELAAAGILSWSLDKTLRLWNRENGECITVFEGHSDAVSCAIQLTEGRILSWSKDTTIRIWDAKSGECLAVFEEQLNEVVNKLGLTDGRLLSWVEWRDTNLRMWDGKSKQRLADADEDLTRIMGALDLMDGRILSWEMEGTLRICDRKTGRRLADLRGHNDAVNGALVLWDGNILSWSWDNTLRIWDGRSGRCLDILEGHTDDVNGAAMLAGGKFISWSYDRKLRLWSWDGKAGGCIGIFDGHSDRILQALVLEDGRILSWSWDKTLRIWEDKPGDCLAGVEGHSDSVYPLNLLVNGCVLSDSSNDSMRIWDGESGRCLESVSDEEGKKRLSGLQVDPKGLIWEIADWGVLAGDKFAGILHKTLCSGIAVWNTDSRVWTWFMQSDGTLVVTQENGQVCFLKLHHGQRRISLAEAEAILVERGGLSAISDQPSVS